MGIRQNGLRKVSKRSFIPPGTVVSQVLQKSGPIGNQDSSILLTGLYGLGISFGYHIVLTFTLGIPKAGQQTGPYQNGFVSDIETGSFHFVDC